MTTAKDKEAFLGLIEENKRIIFKICNSYCRNAADREDLAQEIIYQLWRSAGNFSADHKFSTWMYRVALNVAISFYRKEKKTNRPDSLEDHVIDITDEQEGSIATEHNLKLLQQFIHELKELDKALMLLYLEEKTYSEIAEIIGITETNVATRISRAREQLKQKFTTINY